MWHFRMWFSRHGGVELMVGLDDLRGLLQSYDSVIDGLRGLFQLYWFYDKLNLVACPAVRGWQGQLRDGSSGDPWGAQGYITGVLRARHAIFFWQPHWWQLFLILYVYFYLSEEESLRAEPGLLGAPEFLWECCCLLNRRCSGGWWRRRAIIVMWIAGRDANVFQACFPLCISCLFSNQESIQIQVRCRWL